ncbi:YjbQ family protein [bacterium]|nr:MAG: YjbQ family protein [bacterium]
MNATDGKFICYPSVIDVRTRDELDIVDLSAQLATRVSNSGVWQGLAHLFVAGSTAALTTIEYEPGAISDLKAAISRLAPADLHYDHDARWGDGNGRSHVRAALIGPSLTVPIYDGNPVLGTWQQIVLVELDIRPRSRTVHVTMSGTGRGQDLD